MALITALLDETCTCVGRLRVTAVTIIKRQFFFDQYILCHCISIMSKDERHWVRPEIIVHEEYIFRTQYVYPEV